MAEFPCKFPKKTFQSTYSQKNDSNYNNGEIS